MSEKGNGALRSFSEAAAQIVAEAGDGVLRLQSRRRLPSSAVAWTADGLLVTADHVLEYEEGLTVWLPDGQEVGARLLGRDPGTDVALLSVEGVTLSPLARADATRLRVGSLVWSLGRPFVTGITASMGILSQRTGAWRTWRGGLIDGLLLSDVAMFPGFSGGALIDADGRLAGLNTSLPARGIAASIPYATVERVVEALTRHGRIRRGYLGVSSHPVPLPDDLRGRHGLKQGTGLLVVGVEPGSPAAAAGLVLGDVILHLGDQVVEDGDDLQALLGPETVGSETRLGLLRAGERHDLPVTVGERP